ncbi:MAG: PQQ-binding-like beta-propeller repeat protein [Pseudomonadota bacterium]
MLRFTAILIAIVGAPMIWQGADLALMGGTPYYVIAGILLCACAVDLWRHRARGFFIYAAVVVLTLAWAVYEAGNAFWSVGSRIWIIGLIALWLCTPIIRRRLWGDASPPGLFSLRTVQFTAAATAAVLVAMLVDLASSPVQQRVQDTPSAAPQANDWTAYGSDAAGTRYAGHDQINRDNVADLEVAWEMQTGRPGRFSGTPIQVRDGIYLCTSQNVVIALDGDSGAERWRFDPENETLPFSIFGNCRGVTYHHLPGTTKGEQCAERIYTATTDARMFALDLITGEPCDDFGPGGQISLLAGMGKVKSVKGLGDTEPLYYMVTSPPTLASNALVVGGFVLDNQEVEAPSGVVRAYDPATGALLWAWDIGREGRTTQPPEGGFYTPGTPNVWSLMSADDELGLVYVPTGNATPDYFGAHRTEIMNRYASSIVAIDARTGHTRWHFQTTHNDIWDYDVPAQPTLVDVTIDGEARKALVAPTKRGELFMLDRITGEPIAQVTEQPVPQTDLPGEYSSPTQPFSTGMPSFAHPEINEADMFGISPFDQMACRKKLLRLRWEGTLTPPSLQGTLLYPGPAGGMNWGSVAVDARRSLMVVNSMHLPFAITMVPQEEDSLRKEDESVQPGYGIGGPQRGTPFAAIVDAFVSPISLPCLHPPYGEIAVVDLTTQQTVWRAPMGSWKLGFPYQAGSFVTAGGLIFHAGILDGQLRAYDADTGEVIWQAPLERASEATPMSYVSPATGRQYVLVTTPGVSFGPTSADEIVDITNMSREGGRVIAYALPR